MQNKYAIFNPNIKGCIGASYFFYKKDSTFTKNSFNHEAMSMKQNAANYLSYPITTVQLYIIIKRSTGKIVCQIDITFIL